MSLDRFDGTLDDQAPVFILEPVEGSLTVPDEALLFGADFQRDGHDLLLVNDGAPTIRIEDYFVSDPPSPIFAPNGSQLTGQIVARLAGPIAPGQYAQAGGGTRGGDPIGQVETIEGVATVQRADGTVETLELGIKIFENDVVETSANGKVSLTFADGTIFTLAAASRMIIDDLIYDPDGTDNSATFNLVQGSFVFIAGQVAKTGGMDVTTPSATMGIRGTTVLVRLETVNGALLTEVTLKRDADGNLGSIELRSLDGSLIETINVTDTRWEVTTEDGETFSVERSPVDEGDDLALIADAFAALQSAANRVALGETFVTLPSAAPAADDGGPDDDGSTPAEDVDPFDEPIITDPNPAPGSGGSDGGGGLPEETTPEIPPLEAGDIVIQTDEDSGQDGDIDTGGLTGLTYEIITQPENGTASVDENGNFTYIPNENFFGLDSFEYRVTDGQGESATGTIFVEVAPVNDAPEVDDTTTAAPEDGVLVGTLAATDVDGDPLTFSLVSGPASGTLDLRDDGTYSYIPNADFDGQDSFQVRVEDTSGAFDTATVVINIIPVNDAPVIEFPASVITGDIIEDDEVSGTTATGQIQATDVDGPNDPLEWRLPEEEGVTPTQLVGTYGTLTLTAGGLWTYTLTADIQDFPEGATADEIFTVEVFDGVTAVQQQLTITITGTNDDPVIDLELSALSLDIPEGTETIVFQGQMVSDDVDLGDGETWSLVPPDGAEPSDPLVGAYGTFTISADGQWTYTLTASLEELNLPETEGGASAQEVFTVQVSDDFGGVDEVEITINLLGENDAPVIDLELSVITGDIIEDDEVSGTTATGQLQATDVDGPNDPLEWRLPEEEGVTPTQLVGTYGTLTLTAGGLWTYTLTADIQDFPEGATADEIFTVEVFDGVTAVQQQLTITITGTNDAPVFDAENSVDTGEVTEDSESTTASGTMIATDVDGGDPVWTGVLAEGTGGTIQGTYGVFEIGTDGAWTYTLDPELADGLTTGDLETESFTVRATDAAGGQVDRVIDITINGNNDAPVITSPGAAATGTVTEDDPLASTAEGTLTAQDAENDPLTWNIDGSIEGTYGTLSLDNDGNWTYTLDDIASNSLGVEDTVTDTFDVFVSDGTSNSANQQITITINGSNDAPELPEENVFETVQNVELTGAIVGLDPDGDTLTYSLVTSEGVASPTGTVALQSDGQFTYTPVEGFVGFDTFTYQIDDGNGGVTQGEIVIAVETGDSGGNNDVDVTFNVTPTDEAPAGSVVFDANEVTSNEINIIFALDGSGSISDADWNAMLTSIDGALDTLQTRFEGSDTTVTVGFTVFSSDATEVASFDLFSPEGTAEDPRDGWAEEIEALRDEQPGSLTNWAAALEQTDTYLDSTDPNAENFLFFITDGLPSGNDSVWQAARDDLNANHNIIIEAFGLGPAFESTNTNPNSNATSKLTDLDGDDNFIPLSGPEDLEGALVTNPAFNPTLVSMTISVVVDGGETIVLGTQASRAVTENGIDYELALAEVEGLSDELGTSNRFSIEATYDLTGDGVADLTVFTSEVIEKSETPVTIPDGTDITAAQLAGSDLLMGSDFADDISSGAGNDLVSGFAGDDTINAGTGIDTVLAGDGDDRITVADAGATRAAEQGGDSDLVDGGAGQDTLVFEFTNDIFSNVLDDILVRGIETLDMTNGVTNTMRLSLADVVDLSDDTNALLDDAGFNGQTDTALILGDTQDFLFLDDAPGGTWVQTSTDQTLADGTMVDIWQYEVSPGVYSATVGVETDIEVNPVIA